jgi:hypothetical protein
MSPESSRFKIFPVRSSLTGASNGDGPKILRPIACRLHRSKMSRSEKVLYRLRLRRICNGFRSQER